MTDERRRGLPELPELERDYELVRELGRGGSAIVYLARDRELDRDVAIKLIRPSQFRDEEGIARLAREAHTVAKLQHPNIVMLLGTRRLDAGGLALVLQYVPGRSLRSRIREEGPLPVEDAERIFVDVARALGYAHRHRIVHRDVKPENVYLDEGAGVARLADFGIARPWDSDSGLTLPGTALGTPTYMSPEQVDGRDLDGRSDLYALGVVAWEMLAGRQPWEGEGLYRVIYNQKHVELPPLAEARPDTPPALARAIEGALRKDRAERWGSAGELLAELGRADAPADARVPVGEAGRDRTAPSPTPPGVASDPSSARIVPQAAVLGRRPTGDPNDAGPDVPPPLPGPPPRWGTGSPRRRRTRRVTGAAVAAGLVVVLGAVGAAGVFGNPDAPVRSLLAQILPGDGAEAPGVDEPYGSWVPGEDGPAAAGAGGPREVPAGPEEPAGEDPAPWASDEPFEPGAEEASDADAAGPDEDEEPAAEPDDEELGADEVPDAPDVEPVTAEAEGDDAEGGPPPATLLAPVPALLAGGTHTCALEASGALRCWGDNARGQLGTPGPPRRTTPAAPTPGGSWARVAVGLAHTCALDADGTAHCWGANESGQLGDGTTAERSDPTPVAQAPAFVEIEAGVAHTCGLTSEGEVLCWGANDAGQLGDGGSDSRTTPAAVDAPGRFRALAAGWRHTCALDEQGTAHCWGTNSAGELGRSALERYAAPARVAGGNAFVELSAGNRHTCGLTTTGRVLCWGANEHGQLGEPSPAARRTPSPVELPGTFVSVAAGGVHSCALEAEGAAFCWGRNVHGQLGDGSTEDRATPVRVEGSRRFDRLHAFGAHTCARSPSGEAFCWGYNAEGQLGEATRQSRNAPARVGDGG